jgi:hypothetical protein
MHVYVNMIKCFGLSLGNLACASKHVEVRINEHVGNQKVIDT